MRELRICASKVDKVADHVYIRGETLLMTIVIQVKQGLRSAPMGCKSHWSCDMRLHGNVKEVF